MKRWIAILGICSLLLSGCSGVFGGHYHSVEPHEAQKNPGKDTLVSAESFEQLCQVLADITEAGVKEQIISVAQYHQDYVDKDMRRAIWKVQQENPITAYAVEKITYEKGTSGGQLVVAVHVTYLHDKTEIQKIKNVRSIKDIKRFVNAALYNCDATMVVLVEEYEQTDFVQLVEDYAINFPQMVMEMPQVAVNIYPESGQQRVVELKLSYQNSREDLRQMQELVGEIFASAELYVKGQGPYLEKFSQLYSFLMERYDYQLDTSLTPAYSLLHYGVGDAKAFATVYAAMCAQSGMRCQTVTGTRWGEPWYWNLICVDDVYYHIDLLRCSEEGGFTPRTDVDMEGYVWDFSAYPQSVLPDASQPDPTQPSSGTSTESTAPNNG